MSNPGVLTLTERKLGRGISFRVEDNLGESIHFHYKNIRVDLTVKELLEIADICDTSIYKLVDAEGFELDDYNGDFLMKHASEFLDLKSVEEKTVEVRKLKYIAKNPFGIPVRKNIKDYGREKGKKRAEGQKYMPVIFNDDNVLMYGMYAAYRCYRANPGAKIKIKCLRFDKNRYSAPKHPALDHFFRWDKNRIIELLYAIAGKIFHL